MNFISVNILILLYAVRTETRTITKTYEYSYEDDYRETSDNKTNASYDHSFKDDLNVSYQDEYNENNATSTNDYGENNENLRIGGSSFRVQSSDLDAKYAEPGLQLREEKKRICKGDVCKRKCRDTVADTCINCAENILKVLLAGCNGRCQKPQRGFINPLWNFTEVVAFIKHCEVLAIDACKTECKKTYSIGQCTKKCDGPVLNLYLPSYCSFLKPFNTETYLLSDSNVADLHTNDTVYFSNEIDHHSGNINNHLNNSDHNSGQYSNPTDGYSTDTNHHTSYIDPRFNDSTAEPPKLKLYANNKYIDNGSICKFKIPSNIYERGGDAVKKKRICKGDVCRRKCMNTVAEKCEELQCSRAALKLLQFKCYGRCKRPQEKFLTISWPFENTKMFLDHCESGSAMPTYCQFLINLYKDLDNFMVAPYTRTTPAPFTAPLTTAVPSSTTTMTTTTTKPTIITEPITAAEPTTSTRPTTTTILATTTKTTTTPIPTTTTTTPTTTTTTPTTTTKTTTTTTSTTTTKPTTTTTPTTTTPTTTTTTPTTTTTTPTTTTTTPTTTTTTPTTTTTTPTTTTTTPTTTTTTPTTVTFTTISMPFEITTTWWDEFYRNKSSNNFDY